MASKQVSGVIHEKVEFKTKSHKQDEERYFINIKDVLHKNALTAMIIYILKNIASQFKQEKHSTGGEIHTFSCSKRMSSLS